MASPAEASGPSPATPRRGSESRSLAQAPLGAQTDSRADEDQRRRVRVLRRRIIAETVVVRVTAKNQAEAKKMVRDHLNAGKIAEESWNDGHPYNGDAEMPLKLWMESEYADDGVVI